MSSIDPAAALAAGILCVTPNKRLARALIAQHDAAKIGAGVAAWASPRALPWHAWLLSLWQDALAAGALAAPRPLLPGASASVLWERIVRAHGGLLDPQGAAVDAAEAWATFHAWREPDDRFESWANAGIGDDAAAFGSWAAQFAHALETHARLDVAQLPELLAAVAPRMPGWPGIKVLLAGFLALSPQQQRLLAALRARGAIVDMVALPQPRAARRSRIECDTATTELATALLQSRAWAIEAPDADIGIVIGDLRERRAEVRAAADDILCPALAARAAPDLARPYNVSLGERLADVPIVHTALALLGWLAAPLPVAEAAALLRSRYLPGGRDAWLRRACVERLWRKEGGADVTYTSALSTLAQVDRELAERWHALTPPASIRQSPAAWADSWRAWLAALGWPGDDAPGSDEWQARDAFWRELGAFAALGDIAGVLARTEALATLRSAVARAQFQPEDRGARIQILGTLEASGLAFDRLWVTGMSAARWPAPAAPTPLLPIAWQRARGVPRADAGSTLEFAQATTAAFAVAAPIVVASHPRREDDADAPVSLLVADWPVAVPAQVAGGQVVAIAASRPAMETLADAQAPPLLRGAHAQGGAGIIESQSACPFQAFARYRLRISEWPALAAGLAPDERGKLVHGVLASFWQAVGDQAHLQTLAPDLLQREIEAAVAQALGTIDPRRWRALPGPVAAAEGARLCVIVHAWLHTVDAMRPPFAVQEREMQTALVLGDLSFGLRIDRVDRLADGGVAIIDYKSGATRGPAQWFQSRPAGTQLGVYALALRAADPDVALRAVAYGQLKAGEVRAVGAAADAAAWPGLPVAGAKFGLASWSEVEARWHTAYGALAEAYREGDAAVTPRNALACRHCGMQTLCRIQGEGSVDDGDDDPAQEGDRGGR